MKTKSNVYSNFSFILLLMAIMAFGLDSTPSAFAASGNWNVDAAGNWSDTTKWSPAAVPGTAAGDVVGLNFNITAARIVTLDTAATVGILKIGDPTSSYFGYTLSGGSILTFDNSGSGANLRQVTSGGANDTISTPIALSDNLTIYNVNGLTNSGVISGSGYAITKAGTGKLTLNGSAVNTYTGPTTVTAGTLLVDFANMASPTDLINNGSTLTLGGGTLQIKQKSATTSSQTFANTTLAADSSTAVIGTQVTSGALTINLGTITNSSSATVDFTLPTGGNIAVTNAVVNGVLGGWATMGNNVSSSTVGDWATTNASGNVVAYTGYTTTSPSGLNNALNYKIGSGTIAANTTINSLVLSGASGDTAINSGITLTLSSGGLFIGGTVRWLTAGNSSSTVKSGLASGELYLHCNNAGFTDYGIYPVIADGSVATKLIKDGPGALIFRTNPKTYTGGTVVNGGSLDLNIASSGTATIRNSLTINPGATVTTSVADALGYAAGGVSVTNVNIVGGTLNHTVSGNQGYRATFNLTGGTASSTGGGTFNFDPTTGAAINSLASPVVSTISAGVTLRGSGLVITTALGTVPSGIDLTISGAIGQSSSGYNLTKEGTGTLRLSATATYTGGTTVNAGTLDLNTGGSAGCIRGTVTVTNAVLQLSAGDATGYAGDATSLTTINLTNGANLNVIGANNETIGNCTINMTGASITGNSGGNIDFYQGSSALKTFAASVSSTISGTQISPLRQGSTTFTVADGAAAIDLDISSVIRTSPSSDAAGAVFIKAGAGYMRLGAANTYARNTRIDDGTLALGVGGSISNSPTNTLNSSTAVFDVSATTYTLLTNQFLVGRGTVVGTVNVNSGGTITAGTNNVGNLTLSGLTFNGTATNNVRPGAATLVVTNSNGLTTSGAANSVRLNLGAGALTAGTYTLIDYEGTIQGTGFSAFVLGTTPGGLFSYALSDNTGNSSVDLVVTALTYNWTGAQSTEWSINAIAGSKNWKQSGSPIDYANGQPVVFDDTATGTNTVDLSVADVTPSSVSFNNVNSNYTLQGSAAIAGTIGITKSGAGTVTISNTNKFTGALTINAGTLAANIITNAGTNSSIGAGTNITLAGGTLSYTGGTTSSDRPVSVSSASTLDVATGATTLTLGGAITGAGGVTKTGSGTLVLNNAGNTYASTTINAGTVSVDADAKLSSGVITFGGGTLALTGASAFSSGKTITLNGGGGTIQVDNTAGVTFTAPVGGSGGLTKTGTNSLTLNSASSSYTGPLIVSAGLFTVGAPAALGATNSGTTVASGATLSLNAQTLTAGETVTVAGTGAVGQNSALLGGGGATIQGNLILSADASIGSGSRIDIGNAAIQRNIQGAFTLTKTGTSDVWFHGPTNGVGNSVTNLIINQGKFGIEANDNALNGVPITVNASGRLSSYANVAGTTATTQNNPITLNGGALVSSFDGQTYSGGVTLTANSTLSAAVENSSFKITGAIGESGGSYGLTKGEASRVTFGATNSYTGATTVTLGVLQVGDGTQGQNLIASASAITLGVNATSIGAIDYRLNGDFTFDNTVNIGHTDSGFYVTMAGNTDKMAVTNATSFTNANKGIFNVAKGKLSLENGADFRVKWFELNNANGTNANLTIASGASFTAKYLGVGDRDVTSGSVVQSGGTVTLLGGDADCLGMRLGHWPSAGGASSTYDLTGGTFDATAYGANITISYDGAATMSVGGGAGAATAKVYGINWDAATGDSVTGTLNVLANGTVEVGAGGFANNASANDKTVFNGGTLKATATATWFSPITMTGAGTIEAATNVTATQSGVVSGAGALAKSGTGTLIFSGAKTYSGATVVSNGTLSLASGGSISNTPSITIAGGAVFSVVSTFNLRSIQTLASSGGTAIIAGNVNSGSGTVALAYASGTPSLTVSNTFTLSSATTFTVNNTGSQLAHGTYMVISKSGSGVVTGTVPAVTVTGGGAASGATLQTNGGELYLVVNQTPTASNITIGAQSGVTVTLKIIGGKHAPADGDGDTLTVGSVTQPTDGTAATDGTNITYTSTNTFTGTNTFNYTVSDGYNGSATATVTVVVAANGTGFNKLENPVNLGDGSFRLSFLGIPGTNYALEWTGDLAPPIVWTPQLTNIADANGSLIFTNSQDTNGVNFWRTHYVQ